MPCCQAAILFRVLYEIDGNQYSGWPYSVVFICYPIIILSFFLLWKLPAGAMRKVALTLLSVCLLFTALLTIPYYESRKAFSTAVQQYQNQDYEIVDGIVSRYYVSSDRITDRFYVGRTEFCVKHEADSIPGFHQTRAIGSQIQDGDHVKLSYRGSTILRVDLLQ